MRYPGRATLGLLLVLSPVGLNAQTIPSHYRFIETNHTLGLYGGYLLTNEGSDDLGPRPAPLFGTRYNIHFTGPLSGEIGVGGSVTDRTIYARAASGTAGELISPGDTDVVILLGEAGLRFQFTGARAWRGIAPFAVASGGFIADLTRSSELEEIVPEEQRFSFGPGFAASAGLGSDVFLTERLSLRAEARDYLWRLTTPAGLTETGAKDNEWVHNFALTLGGAIHF